jgi:hypothetical protein
VISININPDDSASGWSVLADALPVMLGAAIAFGSTWWFGRRDERAKNRGLGYALVLRVNEATQTVLQLRNMLTKHLTEVGSPEVPYMWLVAEIPAGFTWRENVVFPPEELAIFARAQRNEVLIKLGELARLHNIVVSAAAEYAKRREALSEKLRALSETRVLAGTHVRSAITGADKAKIEPDIAVVESLLAQLLLRLDEGALFATRLAREIGPEVRRALDDKEFKLGLTFEEEEVKPEETS